MYNVGIKETKSTKILPIFFQPWTLLFSSLLSMFLIQTVGLPKLCKSTKHIATRSILLAPYYKRETLNQPLRFFTTSLRGKWEVGIGNWELRASPWRLISRSLFEISRINPYSPLLLFSLSRLHRVRERVKSNFIILKHLREELPDIDTSISIHRLHKLRFFQRWGLHFNRSPAEEGKCLDCENLVWFFGFGFKMIPHCYCFILVATIDFSGL